MYYKSNPVYIKIFANVYLLYSPSISFPSYMFLHPIFFLDFANSRKCSNGPNPPYYFGPSPLFLFFRTSRGERAPLSPAMPHLACSFFPPLKQADPLPGNPSRPSSSSPSAATIFPFLCPSLLCFLPNYLPP